MTLKTRIYLMFTVAGLYLVIMAWSSYNYLNQLQQSFVSFSEKTIPVFEDLQNLRLGSTQLLASTQILLTSDAANTPQVFDDVNRQMNELNRTLRQYEKAVNKNFPDEKIYLLEIKTRTDSFFQTIQMTEQSALKSPSSTEEIAMSYSLLKAHRDLANSLDRAYQHELEELETKKTETNAALATLANFTVWRVLFGLLMLAVLAYLSVRLLLSALARTSGWADQLLSGKPFVGKASTAKDELAIFENHFRTVAEQLQANSNEQKRLKKALEDQITEKENALVIIKGHEAVLTKQVANRTQELEIAKTRAERANAAKTTFLAMMSHEIRTPLNAVIGLTQVLQQQADSLPVSELFKSHLERIRQGGEVLLATANTILDIAKIESGKMSVIDEDFALEETLFGLCSFFDTQAKQKDIIFERCLEPSLRMMVRTDRTKLIQILNNLLSNAIKFTPAEGTVTVTASLQNNLLNLKVKDTGIGIPADRIDMIFESFEQADDSITRRHGGSGLGLTIVRHLVTLLNGTISLTSAVGQGSEFIVVLPLRLISATRLSPYGRAHADELVWSDIKIMVVEDNEVNQAVITALLKSFDTNVIMANNGLEAIALLETEKPDLILMDLHMPGISGIETTRRILNNPAHAQIPIIALSADAMLDQQNNAKAAGMVDYLIKPIESWKLRHTLSNHLSQRK
jgi:signal transduction histidine kinase/ActR/RegA family two-component response regulator